MTAALSLLLPFAAQAAENKPYRSMNGRAVKSAPAAELAQAYNSGGSVAAAPSAAAASGVTPGSFRSWSGDAPRSGAKSRGAHKFSSAGAVGGGSNRRRDSLRREDDPGPRPPYLDKVGAKILTEGQSYKREEAVGAGKTHSMDAGEIVLNERLAQEIGHASGPRHGPLDKLPPPNPGTVASGKAGGNSITPNSPGSGGGGGTTVIIIGGTINGNQSGGKDHGDAFGGGTGYDGKGH